MSVSPATTRSLGGARVLLVGASGGIGRPLAAAFAGRGARLALTRRERIGVFADLGVGQHTSLVFDLADTAAAPALIVAAAEALGGLDGVVCCAGAVAFGPLDEIPPGVLHEIVAVDLEDRSMLARAAIPVLPRGGFILNVSGVIAELPYSRPRFLLGCEGRHFRGLPGARARGTPTWPLGDRRQATAYRNRPRGPADPRGAPEDARGARPGCGGRATRARGRAGRARRARKRFPRRSSASHRVRR